MTREEKIRYLTKLIKHKGNESFQETEQRLRKAIKERGEQYPNILIFKAVRRIRNKQYSPYPKRFY